MFYVFSINHIAVVTITSGLISYPIDTIRRRMMMTSGQAVKYKGSMDCAVQVVKNEGFMSLMKGAGQYHSYQCQFEAKSLTHAVVLTGLSQLL